MDLPTHEPGIEPVPAEFLDQVRLSLEHIYDMPYLTNRPLRFPDAKTALRGKNLKIELIRRIESMNPGASFSMSSREARPYHLLNLRYIQKMGVEEISNRLSISVRQAYRDLRAGEEYLAALLWENRSALTSALETNDESAIKSEISRFSTNVQSIDLKEILHTARQVTGELAHQRHVYIQIMELPASIPLMGDPTIAQQLIVSLFSLAIRQAENSSTIDIRYEAHTGQVWLQYRADPDQPQQLLSAPIYQLAQHLNWSITLDEPGLLCSIQVDFKQKPKVILIVEDNEGVIELFRRFLTDQPVLIISSTSAPDGLRLAAEVRPDLILLDVMMQDLDGWEFLRRLKREPTTAQIPVIICSVFFEPDLARSLGAVGFLTKPVTQQNLLQVLGESGVLPIG